MEHLLRSFFIKTLLFTIECVHSVIFQNLSALSMHAVVWSRHTSISNYKVCENQ